MVYQSLRAWKRLQIKILELEEKETIDLVRFPLLFAPTRFFKK